MRSNTAKIHLAILHGLIIATSVMITVNGYRMPCYIMILFIMQKIENITPHFQLTEEKSNNDSVSGEKKRSGMPRRNEE
ncbi:hypothetical protein RYD26_10170 [Pasteurellaceae bacterium LIM206]|nr:hypothetical protein [Pasteurellaceae bacterium LIM206]